jgi:hypothetical protein
VYCIHDCIRVVYTALLLFLGFLRLAKAIPDAKLLDLKAMLDWEAVRSFVEFLQSRNVGNGTLVEYCSAFVMLLKFLLHGNAEAAASNYASVELMQR